MFDVILGSVTCKFWNPPLDVDLTIFCSVEWLDCNKFSNVTSILCQIGKIDKEKDPDILQKFDKS